MNLRRLLLQLTYRVIFASGIAALLWVGGNLVYAKAFQLYALSSLGSGTAFQNDMKGAGAHLPPALQTGDLIGRLDIPGTGTSVAVLEGVDDHVLVIAAGHVPGTAATPETAGNIAIAAHRDTFFNGLRKIRVGDVIEFSTRRETFRYLVTTTEVVSPSDTRVLESHGREELTLITCYPFSFLGAAPQRFIVHAQPETTLNLQ